MLREAGLIAALLVAACGQAPREAAGPLREEDTSDGFLINETRQPLAGWTVEARFEPASDGGRAGYAFARAETDARGRFPCFGIAQTGDLAAWPPGDDGSVCRRVSPGRVRLSARGIRLSLGDGTVDGRPRGRVRTPAPSRPPPLAIEGVVTDLADRPIALAWVRFRPVRGGFAEQTLCDFDGRFTEIYTADDEYDVTVLVPHPTKPYGPGVPAGRVKGGTSGVALRLPR